nr:hypothetical protein [Angustibacter aerolatus]
MRGGERVAMLVGQGALGAEEQVAAVAAALGAGVATSLLGMAVVDQREPWVTGAIGLLGTRPAWDLMQECDRLLIVGSAMPYTEFYPPAGVPSVQIDVDGAQARSAVPDRPQPGRRRRPDPRRAARPAGRPGGADGLARAARRPRRQVAEGSGAGRRPARAAAQPAARRARARRAAAGRRDDRRRLRHGDRVVRPPPQGAPRDDRQPLGHAAVDGRRSAVRDRCQDLAPRPAGDRAARRRRDADERRERA